MTGAGRGIGRGIARALAASGASVMSVARTEAELASLQAEIGGAYAALSLIDEAGCTHAVEATRARLGPVGILVNNAGDGEASDGPAWEIDPADWRAKLAVNLDAPFHLTRLVLPGMLAAGEGRIINIASTAGLVGGAEMTTFVTSKHALVGLTRAVAIDAGAARSDLQCHLPGLGAHGQQRGTRRGVGRARGVVPPWARRVGRRGRRARRLPRERRGQRYQRRGHPRGARQHLVRRAEREKGAVPGSGVFPRRGRRGSATVSGIEDVNPKAASSSSAEEPARERRQRHARRAGMYFQAVLAVALLTAIVALLLANGRTVEVSWVIGSSRQSVIWIVLVTAILGWLLGIFTSVLIRHRTRRAR